jgi:hypothetical protein
MYSFHLSPPLKGETTEKDTIPFFAMPKVIEISFSGVTQRSKTPAAPGRKGPPH